MLQYGPSKALQIRTIVKKKVGSNRFKHVQMRVPQKKI